MLAGLLQQGLFVGGMSFMLAAASWLSSRHVAGSHRFERAGRVKNLLDRNYFYWAGFPEEGRNWYLTLRYTF
jgi:outer membrane receptor protein involved in Fe transport